jgi:hypothetical protein
MILYGEGAYCNRQNQFSAKNAQILIPQAGATKSVIFYFDESMSARKIL